MSRDDQSPSRRQTPSAHRHPRGSASANTQLTLEPLEDRLAPVVGAYSHATPVDLGTGLDGVALVQGPTGSTNSGTLLSSGRHVLTAAHSVDANGDHLADGPVRVRFDLPGGRVSYQIEPVAVTIAPGWQGLTEGKIPRSGHDWAVLTLPEVAPAEADRYDIYRGSGEVGQTFLVVGYGSTGTGDAGSDLGTVGVKRVGVNRFDSDSLNLGGDRFPPGRGLAADFDSGNPVHDAFGKDFGRPDTGLGAEEAMIGPGDSGGPALLSINGTLFVAGIANFALYGPQTDVDYVTHGQPHRTNNSFGEYFAYTRVSSFASEIDAIVGTSTPPAPPTPPVPVTPPPVPPVTSPPGETPQGGGSGATFAVGADLGAAPEAKLLDDAGRVQFSTTAYPAGFRGGVRVATADVNGDGTDDLITAPGPGIAVTVNVFDGATGNPLRQISAFESGFLGGGFVTATDLNGDGFAEIIVSPDMGGGPRVRVFDGQSGQVLADFLGIDDPNFRGGARLGRADVNGDGTDDLLVGAGYGGGPRVAVFDGRALASGSVRKVINDFFAFEPALRNGVHLSGGDFDGDGIAEIVASGGPGGGPRVMVISGASLLQSNGRILNPLANFFAGNLSFRGGVRVAVKDLDTNGQADLIVSPGEGGGTTVRIYRGGDVLGNPTPTPAFMTDALMLTNGVFVG